MKTLLVGCLSATLLFATSARADVNTPGPVDSYKAKIDDSINRGLAFLAQQ